MKIQLLLLTLLTAVSLQAQISISREDFPQIGVNYFYSNQNLQIEANLVGDSGASKTWDMTRFTQQTRDTLRAVARADWNGVDSLPTSEWVLSTNEKVLYLTENLTGIQLLGQIDTSFIAYTPPLQYAVFPLTFRLGFESRSESTISEASLGSLPGSDVPDNGIGDFDSIRTTTTVTLSDTVDAWGSITTPAGQYEALRVRSYKRINRIYYIHRTDVAGWNPYQPVGGTLPVDTIEYKWWAKGLGSEVFKIKYPVSTGSNTQNQSIARVSWLTGTSAVTAVGKKLAETEMILGPNPNNGLFTISGNIEQRGPYSLSVTDMPGQEVYATKLQNLNTTLDLTFLKEGVYCLKMTNGESNYMLKRFVVIK